MKQERWRQIDELLDAALERDPKERAAFLDEACAGDEALRQEVEALLASDEHAESFIQTPVLEVAGALLAKAEPAARVGKIIGHYKVLLPLGAGGMGEV